jgi:hypothetical protein
VNVEMPTLRVNITREPTGIPATIPTWTRTQLQVTALDSGCTATHQIQPADRSASNATMMMVRRADEASDRTRTDSGIPLRASSANARENSRSPVAVRVLSDASSALAEGELLQREDAWNVGVSRERYEQRCDLKTARLFQAACELGALEGTAPVDVLGRFGRRIGLAFQMLDDVLDVSGPAERTGKHRGTDLLDGTVTLPLIWPTPSPTAETASNALMIPCP